MEHCRRGELSEVKAAVGRGVDVNSVDSAGQSGLMEAVKNSHNTVINWLLQQRDIDVSRRGMWGYTALHEAVYGNKPAILSLLLAHPTADPTARDGYERTPLEHCRWGTVDRGDLVVIFTGGGTPCEGARILEDDERRTQGGGRAAGVGIADRELYHF